MGCALGRLREPMRAWKHSSLAPRPKLSRDLNITKPFYVSSLVFTLMRKLSIQLIITRSYYVHLESYLCATQLL